MDPARRRTVPIVAAAALAAVLVTGCGAGTPAPAPTSASGGSSAVTTSAVTSAAPAPAARIIRVTYAGGKVTGDTGRITVALGTAVDLVVTSDVADEVHLHGYDKSADVPAGGTATVSFTADIPGGFEAELEGLGTQLVQIQVS